ncbi:MAG TPA: L-fucose/L-arabinose isomerase family protein [Spirochaetia bacterium]|nr:L-fucose/L-arabinose isomerase family protein [Spirochaetia bacterium]
MNERTQLRLERRNSLTANIGILGVGHKTYWAQFEGLKDKLFGKLTTFEAKVAAQGLKTVNFGMVDDSQSAYAVLPGLKANDLDLLFIDMLTYATSATFAPIARMLDLPIVLVALQPSAAMDYAHGEIFVQLLNDDICSLPEFAGVSVRMGRRVPETIIGMLDGDPKVEEEIARWCRIASAVHDLRTARIGLMGHVLESMYDMHTDPALITQSFGCHVVQTEPDEVLETFMTASEDEISEMSHKILSFFDTPNPVSDPVTRKLTDDDLRTAAHAAVALERFIDKRSLTGLAYYYEATEGSEMRRLVTNFIVGNSLLCAQGFPMCGEFDLKTCVAMLIMDRLGIGGSFAEFHPVDFNQNTVLVGHDGPHHINIADGRPVLRSLTKYHGKPGAGASVEFKIKVGPITMLSISVGSDRRLKFVIAEGESIDFPIPPTGNTNTHGRFGSDIRKFLKRWLSEGPTHHFALGVGHHAHDIKRIADIFGIDSVIVTEGLERIEP